MQDLLFMGRTGPQIQERYLDPMLYRRLHNLRNSELQRTQWIIKSIPCQGDKVGNRTLIPCFYSQTTELFSPFPLLHKIVVKIRQHHCNPDSFIVALLAMTHHSAVSIYRNTKIAQDTRPFDIQKGQVWHLNIVKYQIAWRVHPK